MRLIRLAALVAGFTGLLLGGSTVAVLSVLVVTPLVAAALWSCSVDGRLLASAPADL
jgi:predicted cobalt transporter CbtA